MIEVFIWIIVSIYSLKIVIVKLQEIIVREYHNITIIDLPRLTDTQ
jgi:hypothetical protein